MASKRAGSPHADGPNPKRREIEDSTPLSQQLSSILSAFRDSEREFNRGYSRVKAARHHLELCRAEQHKAASLESSLRDGQRDRVQLAEEHLATSKKSLSAIEIQSNKHLSELSTLISQNIKPVLKSDPVILSLKKEIQWMEQSWNQEKKAMQNRWATIMTEQRTTWTDENKTLQNKIEDLSQSLVRVSNECRSLLNQVTNIKAIKSEQQSQVSEKIREECNKDLLSHLAREMDSFEAEIHNTKEEIAKNTTLSIDKSQEAMVTRVDEGLNTTFEKLKTLTASLVKADAEPTHDRISTLEENLRVMQEQFHARQVQPSTSRATEQDDSQDLTSCFQTIANLNTRLEKLESSVEANVSTVNDVKSVHQAFAEELDSVQNHLESYRSPRRVSQKQSKSPN